MPDEIDIDDETPTQEIVLPDVPSSVADEIRRIAHAEGKLTANVLVDHAADPDSPLHDRFEWDDTVAAHEYRLEQARNMIRRIHVELYAQPVREFVYVPSTGSYQPIGDIIASPSYQAEVLTRFQREADGFAARWRAHRLAADAYKEWLAKQLDE